MILSENLFLFSRLIERDRLLYTCNMAVQLQMKEQ